ncbi:MAG TPA: hypothetical protein VIL64_04805, partial [Solirubrobacteraceae bacterium]
MHGRALLTTPVLALALAAPAWADDLPVLAKHVHFSADGPGYVRVTVPKDFTAANTDAQGKTTVNVHMTIHGGRLYSGVMLYSEFLAEALPGTPNGPMVPMGFAAGGDPDSSQTTNGFGNGRIAAGTYRLYALTAPGAHLEADITLDPLDGDQSLSPTVPLPAEDKTMTVRTGSDGRSVAGAFVHMDSHGLIWHTRSSQRGTTQVGQGELCDYGPAADPSQPDAFDAGCPGGKKTFGDTPSPPLPGSGDASTYTNSAAQPGGTYGYGVNEYVLNGPPGLVSGEVLGIPYELPDGTLGADVQGRPLPNHADGPAKPPAGNGGGTTPAGVVTTAGAATQLGEAALVTI